MQKLAAKRVFQYRQCGNLGRLELAAQVNGKQVKIYIFLQKFCTPKLRMCSICFFKCYCLKIVLVTWEIDYLSPTQITIIP